MYSTPDAIGPTASDAVAVIVTEAAAVPALETTGPVTLAVATTIGVAGTTESIIVRPSPIASGFLRQLAVQLL